MQRHCRIRSWTVLSVVLIGWNCADTQADQKGRLQRRHPVAMAAVNDTLVIANHDSGTLSLIKASTRKLFAEHRVAKQLIQVTAVGGNRLAVLEADPARVTFYALQ